MKSLSKKMFPLLGILLGSFLMIACVADSDEKKTGENDIPVKYDAPLTVSDNAPLKWDIRLDNPYYLTEGDKKFVYLYLEVKGGEAKTDKKRAPLNLSLVLDRSGSMSGDKLKHAKKAIGFVINQLTQEDILSIIQYDDAVQVVSSSAPLNNKEVLHKKVESIQTGGSTNLCGGMQEGYVQVKSAKKSNYINRVLLLSDGLANVGITEPAQIEKIAQKNFREDGVATSTFGVGADYNENLMTGIAENGGANYYFIDNPDKIPGIFAKELEGLLSVVSQSTKVRINYPTNQLNLVKVFGYPHYIENDEIMVNLNDVYAKEEKAILLKFEVKGKLEKQADFICHLSYTDASSLNENKVKQSVTLRPTSDEQAYKQGEDLVVKENIVLFESTDLFDEVMKEADSGNFEKAKEKGKKLDEYMLNNSDSRFSDRFEKQKSNVSGYNSKLEEMESMPIEDQKVMQKSSKDANYQMKKKK